MSRTSSASRDTGPHPVLDEEPPLLDSCAGRAYMSGAPTNTGKTTTKTLLLLFPPRTGQGPKTPEPQLLPARLERIACGDIALDVFVRISLLFACPACYVSNKPR